MTKLIAFTVHERPDRVPTRDRELQIRDPGFGRFFTDHVARVTWTADLGWHDAVIEGLAPIPLHPATMVLHYGQAVFEGLKAYRTPDGDVRLFRPDLNAARLNRSAERLAMPSLPEGVFIDACDGLVHVDRDWIPTEPGRSLYLRPVLFASETHLGVRGASRFEFVVIASPADPFFASEPVPITVQIPDADVRAVLGGTGEAKCAGNYAASLRARQLATAQGCDEVLWLDAVHHRYIEELSGMNVFLVDTTGSRPTLVTPPLSGALLDGITRRSILELSEDLGFGTREELVSCDEFEDGCASGVFSEAFACGTAAVVAPIGRVRRSDGSGWQVGDGLPGPVTMRVRSSLLALQEGRIDDARGWTHLVRGDAAPA